MRSKIWLRTLPTVVLAGLLWNAGMARADDVSYYAIERRELLIESPEDVALLAIEACPHGEKTFIPIPEKAEFFVDTDEGRNFVSVLEGNLTPRGQLEIFCKCMAREPIYFGRNGRIFGKIIVNVASGDHSAAELTELFQEQPK